MHFQFYFISELEPLLNKLCALGTCQIARNFTIKLAFWLPEWIGGRGQGRGTTSPGQSGIKERVPSQSSSSLKGKIFSQHRMTPLPSSRFKYLPLGCRGSNIVKWHFSVPSARSGFLLGPLLLKQHEWVILERPKGLVSPSQNLPPLKLDKEECLHFICYCCIWANTFN